MLPPDHAECFRSTVRAVACYAEGLQCVNRGFQQDLVIIDDQHIHRVKFHVLPLPVSHGKIQDYGKCRSLSLLALAVDGAFHQFDHLLCDRKSESGSLNAVHPAVRLAREWLVHGFHKFRTHADAGI